MGALADGHLIVLSTFLQLAPKWFVSSSLLVAGNVSQERVYRTAVASALMLSLSLEMLWTLFHPAALSHRTAGACLALSTVAQVVACVAAFEAEASPSVVFGCLAVGGCLSIPVNQLGAPSRAKQACA